MKLISERRTTTKVVGYSALIIGALLTLTGCGGADEKDRSVEAEAQVFYQMNMHGSGDTANRQLVISGNSVAVYSFRCNDGNASLFTEGGWRGTLTADGNQIIWTEGESGTDDVVFAADGSSIHLQSQPWKAMPEDEAFESACS